MTAPEQDQNQTEREESSQVIPSGVQDVTSRDAAGIISAGVQPSLGGMVGATVVLKGQQYHVLGQLAVSGEAETFLVEAGREKFVFKLYYPKFNPKMSILQALKSLRHQDIISVVDYGDYQGRFFELMEYAEGGSLAEIPPVRSPETLKQIIAEVVEALQFCHSHGIIHRDIKPQNIFFRRTDKKDIVIGDFGISTELYEGFSKKLSSQARTTVYAAPEVFMGIKGKTVIDKAVDYYSLGITLIHIWTGQQPFEELGEYGIMVMKRDGRVEIPADLPREFQRLIKGLLVVNPAKRWGYEEVKQWLRGEVVEVFEEEVKEYPPFVFGLVKGRELEAHDPVSLADLMEAYPELGERHLYKKAISRWLQPVNQYLYTAMETIVEDEYPRDRTAGLIKAIYVLDPERAFKGVDGDRYQTAEEIAQCLEKNFAHYVEALKNHIDPLYLYLEARGYKDEADKFRKLFTTLPSKAALNTLILSLEDGYEAGLKLDGKRFMTPSEFLTTDQSTQEQLAKLLGNPYSKVSLWVKSFPHLADSVERYRFLQRFEPGTLRYALGEGFPLFISEIPEPDSLPYPGTLEHALREGFLLPTLVVKNVEELREFLRWPFEELDPDQIDELNYWLCHYMDVSLNELILEVVSKETLDIYKVTSLSSCAVANLEDPKLGITDVLEKVLEILDRRKAEDGFYTTIANATSKSIATLCRRQDGLTHLEKFINFAKNHQNRHATFLHSVFQQLDVDSLSNMVRHPDVSDQSEVSRVVTLYNDLVSLTRDLAPHSPLAQWLTKDSLRRAISEIKERNKKEKKEKETLVRSKYEELVEERRKVAKKTRPTIEYAIISGLKFLFFGFLFYSLVVGWYTFKKGAELGGIAIDWMEELGAEGAIVGLLAIVIQLLIPAFVAYLGWVLFPVFALWSGVSAVSSYIRWKSRIKKAAQLTPDESQALQESLRNIEDYFRQKEEQEVGQDIIGRLQSSA